jgi:hypothetical protein
MPRVVQVELNKSRKVFNPPISFVSIISNRDRFAIARKRNGDYSYAEYFIKRIDDINYDKRKR